MAKKEAIDFTNVKEGGGQFTKKRLPAGDYPAKITKWEKANPKDKNDKAKMWLYTIAIEGRHGATYPYYCKLVDNQLWKVRNLLVAAGKTVPKKKVGVDPEVVVGKKVGVTLDDAEYDGRDQSEISAVFPASELDDQDATDDDDDDDDDGDEEEEEEEKPKKKKKKSKPEPEPEEDEDDDDDEDSDDEDSDDDDDDEEEEEEPEPPKKKKKKKPEEDDDEDLDELEVEDI